jgi:subtilase family serine protease
MSFLARSIALVFPLLTFLILLLAGCSGGDGTSNGVLGSAEVSSEDGDFKYAHALATTGGAGPPLTPSQIRQLYNIPAPVGSSTVVIIVPYHYPNLQSDTDKFSSKYGITSPVLKIINQAGKLQNNNWALEATIDVAMVIIANPQAKIYVIEAKSASANDLLTAMETAESITGGGAVISMSWGGYEFSTEGSRYNIFAMSENVWVAAVGDDGYVNYPASQPGVIAVGGTTVKLTSSGDRQSETPWSLSGCGISSYESKPAYQNIATVAAANGTAYRSVPDVAFIANPNPGVSIYNSAYGGWISVGGTSVSAPLFAGIIALANASRVKKHLPTFTSAIGSSYALQPYLYDLMSSNGGPNNSSVLYDVGGGVVCPQVKNSHPTTGYTIVSGLGTVNAQALIDYLDGNL